MQGGFIINETQETGVGAADDLTKLFLIHENTVRDKNSKHGALSSQAVITQIDMILDETTITVATAQITLFWDSLGNDIALGRSEAVTLRPGLTDTSLRMATMSVNTRVRRPATQTTPGALYGLITVDAGEVTVKTVRVHWADARSGE